MQNAPATASATDTADANTKRYFYATHAQIQKITDNCYALRATRYVLVLLQTRIRMQTPTLTFALMLMLLLVLRARSLNATRLPC
eukprot:5115018-Lingulodinium_polyedra.AAC.1